MQLPHLPETPILATPELEELDIYATRIKELLSDRKTAASNAADLRQKSDVAAETLKRFRDGKFEEEGKPLTGLSDEEIGARIQKAEGAAVSSLNNWRKAESARHAPGAELIEVEREFCQRWTAVFQGLQKRESDAWRSFAEVHFEPRSPMYREWSELFRCSYVDTFIKLVLSSLNFLTSQPDEELSASATLQLIERMKKAPKL